MSGCYPGETLSMCIHGTPAKLTCAQCSNEHRLNLIESQIKALTEMYKNLSIKVASFEDHRIRQIDENRKASKHFDNIDSSLKVHWDDREYFYKKINDCKECLSHIDDLIEINKSFLERIEKLERQFADFMQKSNLNCEKRPKYCNECGNKNE